MSTPIIITALSLLTATHTHAALTYERTTSNVHVIAANTPGKKNKKDSPYLPDNKVKKYKGYKLIWHDEFDIDGIPSEDWTYEHGLVRNHELQWYQPNNTRVKGGCLVIEGRKEQVKNPRYVKGSTSWPECVPQAEFTSSCVTTQGQREFMYGRFEVRAKIPTAKGAWPAIWLLGNKWEWPNNGEIDMMEYYIKNSTPSVLANVCWGSPKRWTAVWDESVTPLSHFTDTDPTWADKFHVWRMDWDENTIHLYLDDEKLNEIDLSKTLNQGYADNYSNPFANTEPNFGAYILLNLAIGSNGGEPDLSAFPLRYYVDYVRVYQKCH